MSIWGKIGVGAVGLLFGGPLGAAVGVLAGHYLIDRDAVPGDPGVAFTIAMIALAAKMAKADGVVSDEEIAAFERVFRVPPDEEASVRRFFDLARQDTAGYESYAGQIARLIRWPMKKFMYGTQPIPLRFFMKIEGLPAMPVINGVDGIRQSVNICPKVIWQSWNGHHRASLPRPKRLVPRQANWLNTLSQTGNIRNKVTGHAWGLYDWPKILLLSV